MTHYYDYDDLPDFGDRYLQYFDRDVEAIEIRKKSTTEGSLSLSQSMDLIDLLFRKHQMVYVPHSLDKSLYMFPFMFIEPEEGSKIRNRQTDEVYTVDQIIKNPATKKWEGLLRLDLSTPPNIEKTERLEFEDASNYIEFSFIHPDAVSNLPSTNRGDLLREVPPIRPTITWNLVRKEPGSLDKVFSSRKELKARLRESVKDPLVNGYTVQIYGQNFDNIVQFDCWSNSYKTSEKLVGWFEQFINLYKQFLNRSGIQQIFFWQRSDDTVENSWRQTFNVRGTQYYFRTEELHAVYERDLLNLNINIDTDLNENRIFKEKRYIADQLVTGELSYDEYKALFSRSGQHLFANININE